MTNKEKAREIAEYYTDINDIGVALNSAKEMAEWKDQQFKEYLEKKRDYYYNKAKYNDIETLNKIQCLNEIINELFPEKENQDTTDNDE